MVVVMEVYLACHAGRYCLLYPDIARPVGLAGSSLPPRPQLLIDAYDKGNLLGAQEVNISLGTQQPVNVLYANSPCCCAKGAKAACKQTWDCRYTRRCRSCLSSAKAAKQPSSRQHHGSLWPHSLQVGMFSMI